MSRFRGFLSQVCLFPPPCFHPPRVCLFSPFHRPMLLTCRPRHLTMEHLTDDTLTCGLMTGTTTSPLRRNASERALQLPQLARTRLFLLALPRPTTARHTLE